MVGVCHSQLPRHQLEDLAKSSFGPFGFTVEDNQIERGSPTPLEKVTYRSRARDQQSVATSCTIRGDDVESQHGESSQDEPMEDITGSVQGEDDGAGSGVGGAAEEEDELESNNDDVRDPDYRPSGSKSTIQKLNSFSVTTRVGSPLQGSSKLQSLQLSINIVYDKTWTTRLIREGFQKLAQWLEQYSLSEDGGKSTHSLGQAKMKKLLEGLATTSNLKTVNRCNRIIADAVKVFEGNNAATSDQLAPSNVDQMPEGVRAFAIRARDMLQHLTSLSPEYQDFTDCVRRVGLIQEANVLAEKLRQDKTERRYCLSKLNLDPSNTIAGTVLAKRYAELLLSVSDQEKEALWAGSNNLYDLWNVFDRSYGIFMVLGPQGGTTKWYVLHGSFLVPNANDYVLGRLLSPTPCSTAVSNRQRRLFHFYNSLPTRCRRLLQLASLMRTPQPSWWGKLGSPLRSRVRSQFKEQSRSVCASQRPRRVSQALEADSLKAQCLHSVDGNRVATLVSLIATAPGSGRLQGFSRMVLLLTHGYDGGWI